jgi:predicted transcriptional regulator
MTSRAARSVTISVPAEMLEELDRVRSREHRSRSKLLREAFRRYVAGESMQRIPIVEPEPGELDALEHGRAQTARGEHVLFKDLLDDVDADGRERRRKKSQKVSR